MDKMRDKKRVGGFVILKILEIIGIIILFYLIYVFGRLLQEPGFLTYLLLGGKICYNNWFLCGIESLFMMFTIGFLIVIGIILIYCLIKRMIKKNWEWAGKIAKFLYEW